MAEDKKDTIREAQGFRGGMPYGPDVKRLDEVFPLASLIEGRVIEHKDLGNVLRLKPGPGRYYAVVDAWRAKMEREYDLILLWKKGVGIYVALPHERFQHGKSKTMQHMRGVKRGIREALSTPRERLTEDGQRGFDHFARNAIVLKTALEEARKKFPIDVPVIKSLPKPKLVG